MPLPAVTKVHISCRYIYPHISQFLTKHLGVTRSPGLAYTLTGDDFLKRLSLLFPLDDHSISRKFSLEGVECRSLFKAFLHFVEKLSILICCGFKSLDKTGHIRRNHR